MIWIACAGAMTVALLRLRRSDAADERREIGIVAGWASPAVGLGGVLLVPQLWFLLVPIGGVLAWRARRHRS